MEEHYEGTFTVTEIELEKQCIIEETFSKIICGDYKVQLKAFNFLNFLCTL